MIGEAAKSIPDAFKKEHEEVNWRGISGMCDKLINEYFGVSYQIVWKTIKEDIPALKSQIEEIVEAFDKYK